MSKKALIIDDEAQIRDAIASALEPLGWKAEAASVDEASGSLAAAGEEPFEMVFLPVSSKAFVSLSGKARKASAACLVVALADLDRKDELSQAVYAGMADDFLPLPFSPGDLGNVAKLARGAGK